jgi:hypothetical protein
MTSFRNGSIALLFAALAACGDASPADNLRRGASSSGGTPAATVAPDGTPAPEPTAPAPEIPAADAGTDAAGDAATPPVDFFAGAPAYANQAGRSTQVGEHPSGGTARGSACFSCHGPGGAPSMVMGGTVYTDAAGTTPAANVQVVLKVGATFVSANTNAEGNFLVFGAAFAGTAKVAVRNGASSHAMVGGITKGDCNSCHDGTATARIHLP